MAGKKDHSVQVIKSGYRWVASELSGNITISRDGSVIGKAVWQDDQMVHCTAPMPDEVVLTLEKMLKEQIDNNWGE
ncbi:MAG: hypothetical protein IT372_13880 [Polyangiaceae bacterium]|nr:hypothetical protein [Polyangiaceae bacterium]